MVFRHKQKSENVIYVNDIQSFAKAVNGRRHMVMMLQRIGDFSESRSHETQHKMLENSVRMFQNEKPPRPKMLFPRIQ